MEPERKNTILQLEKLIGKEYAEILEKQIYKFVYYKAVSENIPLDWNNRLFSELYFIYSYKYIINCQYPNIIDLLKTGQNIPEKSDIEISDLHKNYVINYQSRDVKYIKDLNCPKCKQYLLRLNKVQSRSLDEGISFAYNCSGCNYSWQEN